MAPLSVGGFLSQCSPGAIRPWLKMAGEGSWTTARSTGSRPYGEGENPPKYLGIWCWIIHHPQRHRETRRLDLRVWAWINGKMKFHLFFQDDY